MSSVWEQRFSVLVKRILGLRESTTLEALPDLMPVLPLLNPDDFSLDILRGDRWVAGRATQAQVAAQGTRIQLFNNTVDRLLFVEEVEVTVVNAVDQVGFYLAGIHLATGNSAGYLDGRDQSTVPTGALSIEFDTSAAAPNTASWLGHRSCQIGVGVLLAPRVVLRPNQALRFETGTVNNGMRASFTYRERAVGPNELNLLGA